MSQRFLLPVIFFVSLSQAIHAVEKLPIPQTVQELWANVDPQKDPLDGRLVREWEREGIVYQYVTFHIGTFKNKPARMAGFYAFPKGGKKLPALLHLHGGGQRAFLNEVEYFAKRGYACLSINWGGREMENAKPGDENTSWGVVDPTQQNVPGYANLKPGEKYLDPVDSPRNNNWYLLTFGCRRGLTFLEQQSEVDPERLGVYGHSMGGNLTVYVAGVDPRVKAAAPSVGGSGFRNDPWPLLPQDRKQLPNGDVKLFNATLGFESYAPTIKAPLLWLGATNDFHGIMDDTYRTGELIPHGNVRYSFTAHMNHRFTPEFAITRPMWFDQYLKNNFTFPQTPISSVILTTDDHVPEFLMTPDASQPIMAVHLYYSVDADPRARFWRSAPVKKSGNAWTAKLPILSIDQPLFAFANVVYSNPKSDSYAISSKLHTLAPKQLKEAGIKATDKPSPIIDEFTNGWQDWYALSPENPHHWEYSTRKLSDPKWQGQPGQRLTFDVRTAKPNELIVVLTENFFRFYRGKSEEFVAVVKLAGGDQPQSIRLSIDDFQAANGTRLSSWDKIDLLSWRAYYEKGDKLLGSKQWSGKQPQFFNLRWADKE